MYILYYLFNFIIHLFSVFGNCQKSHFDLSLSLHFYIVYPSKMQRQILFDIVIEFLFVIVLFLGPGVFTDAKKADGFVKITELKPSHRTNIAASICENCKTVILKY